MDRNKNIVYLTGSHVWNNLLDYDVTSGIQNFDYYSYLNFLQANNHNFIRFWGGIGSGGGQAPTPTVYTRGGCDTASDGDPKYDLSNLNPAYFDRLRARIIEARERGIYVSIMLFKGDTVVNYPPHNANWKHHPFHPSNNCNGISGDLNRDGFGLEVHTLQNVTITALQEAYVRKVIDTVNDLENVIYEIGNEIAVRGMTKFNRRQKDWQYYFIRYIQKYQASKPKQHPVGMTGGGVNGAYPTQNADLFASPAQWISPNEEDGSNYTTDPKAANGRKIIISDTDHLCGICLDSDWVWKSFTRGINPIYMDGGMLNSFPDVKPEEKDVRRAMGQTNTYAKKMNLAAMTPQASVASGGYALASRGSEYLVYEPVSRSFVVNLAKGTYKVEWLNPLTGAISNGTVAKGGARTTFTSPFEGAAVLYLRSASR